LELFGLGDPHKVVNDHPSIDQEDSWYALDFETVCNLWQLVNIYFDQFESTLIGKCDLFESWSELLAGTTPTIILLRP